MRNAIALVAGCLLLCCSSLRAQEQPRQLKGGGHLLDETAEQFFSQGRVGDVLRACQAGDWKSVSHSSREAKDICAILAATKQQATSGARIEYKGPGDMNTMRADTFTLDGGHLVKIDMVYSAPVANFEGYHPKSFGELLAGLQEAYGTPTKTYIERVLDTYGVQYDAHHAVWMGKKDVISINEQPGMNGWTEVVAATLAEYNRAKTANPLQ